MSVSQLVSHDERAWNAGQINGVAIEKVGIVNIQETYFWIRKEITHGSLIESYKGDLVFLPQASKGSVVYLNIEIGDREYEKPYVQGDALIWQTARCGEIFAILKKGQRFTVNAKSINESTDITRYGYCLPTSEREIIYWYRTADYDYRTLNIDRDGIQVISFEAV